MSPSSLASLDRRRLTLALAVVAALALRPASGAAQGSALPTASQAASRRPIASVSAGLMQFDLSGTGSAPMAALRLDLPWSTHLWFEPGVVVSRPEQQFGARSTFVVPEVHVHAILPLGTVAPYVGGGVGYALDLRANRDGESTGSLSLAAALGARFQLTRRAGARAELRVRTLGTEFSGSTAEWTAGLSWRL